MYKKKKKLENGNSLSCCLKDGSVNKRIRAYAILRVTNRINNWHKCYRLAELNINSISGYTGLDQYFLDCTKLCCFRIYIFSPDSRAQNQRADKRGLEDVYSEFTVLY